MRHVVKYIPLYHVLNNRPFLLHRIFDLSLAYSSSQKLTQNNSNPFGYQQTLRSQSIPQVPLEIPYDSTSTLNLNWPSRASQLIIFFETHTYSLFRSQWKSFEAYVEEIIIGILLDGYVAGAYDKRRLAVFQPSPHVNEKFPSDLLLTLLSMAVNNANGFYVSRWIAMAEKVSIQ